MPPSDDHLDPAVVARVVADQFPDLEGCVAVRLGAGWDHEVYLVGELVFRFPSRLDRVVWLQREIEVLGHVRAVLGSAVPDFSYLGLPSRGFPFPFVGYRLVPGVPADARSQRWGRLAADLGALLTRLHSIDVGAVPATPTGEERLPAGGHRLDLSSCAADVRKRLPPALRGPADPYLLGDVPLPPFDGDRVLAHNDIRVEHVLVDETTGGLAGIIDWTDAMVTDPAVDFVGLISIGDWDFVRSVGSAYCRPVDADFWPRVNWLARTLTLRWLGDAIEGGRDIAERLVWVRRAFTDQA